MADRKPLIIPKELKGKYGDNISIYSFSKLDSFRNGCKWEYYLSRIKREKGISDSAYTFLGTAFHDIMEMYYNGEIKREDMITKWEETSLVFEMSDLKFSHDEESSNNTWEDYKSCITHYFNNYKELKCKVISEPLVWVDLEHKSNDNKNALLMGYIDNIHKEDDYLVIEDYKTSTKFKGKDIHEHQKQLLAYSYYFIQNGQDINKIKIRFNFAKYININFKHMISVTYDVTDKEGNIKPKTTTCLRSELYEKIKTPLRAWIKSCNPDIKAKDLKVLADKCVEDNNICSLDKNMVSYIESKMILKDVIRSGKRTSWGKESTIQTQLRKDLINSGCEDIEVEMKLTEIASTSDINCIKDLVDISNYDFLDCYIYGDVNSDTIENLLKEMKEDVDGIVQNGKEECNYLREEIQDSDTFYCNTLCSQRINCEYYKRYIEEYNKYRSDKIDVDGMSDDDILNELLDL